MRSSPRPAQAERQTSLENTPAWLMVQRSCSVRRHTGRTCWKYPLWGNREASTAGAPEGMLGSMGAGGGGLTGSTLLQPLEGARAAAGEQPWGSPLLENCPVRA